MDTTPAKRRPFRGRLVHVPPPSAARRRAGPLALLASVAALALTAAPAQAASPQITATWVTDVTGTSVNFHAEVNPEGLTTTYRFEYITGAKYQANPPGEPFAGAAKAPPGPEAFLGSGATVQPVFQHAGGLASSTVFHYRISATNTGIGGGTTTSSPKTFTTQESTGAFSLLDQRGWEIVSPLGKNGGAIQSFGQNFGGGVLQAAAGGGAITYSSASSFGEAPQGAPPASQYISRRAAGEGGWSTENITTPALSGSYGTEPNGVPYQLFSPDLARGLLLNGEPCRGEGEGCPVANPPLPGTKAPAGYQDYYLRDNENGSFTAVLTDANSELALAPEEFSLAFAGASPDLRHAILSTCAALTPGASEVAGSEGCDPTKPNLYQYEEGQLKLVNTAPGAKLAAQGAAVSSDGFRVYFTEEGLSEEVLWLREGAAAPHELAEGAKFQTATPSGAFAFFTKAGHLSRYDAATHTATDLTPSGGVVGVLGASEDGSRVYFATAAGIFSWHSGTTATVTAAPGAAQASDYPPTAGTARVSADGTRLLFLSAASLTGYDNTDASSGQPDTEVYLFEAEPTELTCISCNPTGERPLGPSSIPGAIANGEGEGATDGRRLFFDSADSLLPADTDNRPDVYEWEAQGEGSCQRVGGCLGLISSGRGAEGASFVDASANGFDAFFLTGGSLVPTDPGSIDLYDARIGGGFSVPQPPIECIADACQPLPQAPEDPTVGTLIPGPGNPPLPSPKRTCPKGKHRVVRHGKARCVASHHKRRRGAGK